MTTEIIMKGKNRKRKKESKEGRKTATAIIMKSKNQKYQRK